MPTGRVDSPDIRIEPVVPAGQDSRRDPYQQTWSVRVDGRELRRFPTRESAQRFVHHALREGRL
jgi:hypothetical protein